MHSKDDKRDLLQGRFPSNQPLIVLGEIHEYKEWRNLLRDRNKREVDFVVLKNSQPLFAVESKAGDEDVSKHISYFAERTDIPAFYQVHQGARDYEMADRRTRVLPFTTFAAEVLKT